LEFDGSSESSVKPGLHENGVVWWDPALLRLQVEASFGLRQEEILSDDGGASFQQYEEWKNQRQQLLRKGETPSLNVFLATDGVEPPAGYASQVQVEHVTRDGPRPSGPRLGSLVHLTFRDVDFAAEHDAILRIARTHSRLLGATEEEVAASTEAVTAALKHPLLRRAASARRCYRELPITLQDTPGTLLEAVLDLAFLEDDGWVVVDFKTDAEDPSRLIRYRRQVGWYMHALERFSQQPSQGWILHL
jgi:ATP-dependent exoDNAse (exonuclease V) beta subunit